jgi:hypothetical protein
VRKRISIVLAGLLALVGLTLGAAQLAGAATPDFGAGKVKGALVAIDVTSPRAEYVDEHGVHHCLPQGPNHTAHATGDYPSMWFAAADPACDFGASAQTPVSGLTKADVQALIDAAVAKSGQDGTRVVHKSVKVDVDYQAGTEAQRTVTFTGLPAYAASGVGEIYGTNVAGIPASLTSHGVNVAVAEQSLTNGQTTRSFVVTPSGFTGSEAFTLDIWVLVTA